MTSGKELYRFLLKEQQCAVRKGKCRQHCNDCTLYSPDAFSMYTQVLNDIKARVPELLFVDDIEELENLIGGS